MSCYKIRGHKYEIRDTGLTLTELSTTTEFDILVNKYPNILCPSSIQSQKIDIFFGIKT